MTEAIGLVLSVIGIADQLTQRLSDIKTRFEDFRSLPANWQSSIKFFENCTLRLKQIQDMLHDHKEAIGEHATSIVRPIADEVMESLDMAHSILKGLENDFLRESQSLTPTSSADVPGSSSKQGFLLFRARKRIVRGRRVSDGRLSLRVKTVRTALEKVNATCMNVKPTLERVVIGLTAVIASHKESPDSYYAHFDEPPLPNNVVLNFRGETMEECLMRTILAESAAAGVTAVVGRRVLGAVGMGGVGKTVALQGLCYESDVRNRYSDGIFYVSLGQDVAEEVVIEGLAHFVESSGGKSLAKDIVNKTMAESAARQASLWFKGKCALFVCDDMWSSDGHPTGYLSSFRLLLCKSPSSALVISTREKSIAQQFMQVEFSPREVRGQQASSILAKYADIQIHAVRASSDAWEAFGDILDVCAGLPVALAAAGTSCCARPLDSCITLS